MSTAEWGVVAVEVAYLFKQVYGLHGRHYQRPSHCNGHGNSCFDTHPYVVPSTTYQITNEENDDDNVREAIFFKE
jgi:hypothetical protein